MNYSKKEKEEQSLLIVQEPLPTSQVMKSGVLFIKIKKYKNEMNWTGVRWS